ncbi:hypothetical protein BU24DRAFT_416397 [Aaosphaeria arxii CBS 175.79]|uniref:F-box domain-containing protein n=1 Tax=Aaosphaeria arxii CBS 175.79 TaxID=1450172 RepID=A0A6A5Y571_9PLEO|nr:uncharacterized protein BU24DRAFT_416397 [Aaosphaeria arxii CBS 175.79]KAF2020705.1 hypothetical protein BU24DRAFT_416397 [Aaosphaeria arxii CBS 175.79]
MVGLNGLPNELLSLVTSHLERTQDVLNLSLASRRLNSFVKLDGWKAFLKGRFGLQGLDSDAQNAVHGLTRLYRSWDRKALTARYIAPRGNVISLNTWSEAAWTGPRGQTMGYRPSIDSYEDTRSSWSDRKEVIAWSAGTNILVRYRDTVPVDQDLKEKGQEEEVPKSPFVWYSHRLPDSREGRDDISALKLLRPHQQHANYKSIVFGTSGGDLSLLQFDPEQKEDRLQSYRTDLDASQPGKLAVGSVAVSDAQDPLLAATLGDTTLALYSISTKDTTDSPIDPTSHVIPTISTNLSGRIWSTNFISEDLLSIGTGPSTEPIQVFAITPGGLSTGPLRKFSLDPKVDAVDGDQTISRHTTSVYPIIPVPAESQGGSERGQTFLSGGYDGIIRLHDMRSPHQFETMYYDVTNDSSIYSLATQGMERVIAGTSMHSMLKVFDLRLSGSHAYSTIPLPTSTTKKPIHRSGDYTVNKIVNDAVAYTGKRPITGGWNLFLNPRNDTRNNNSNHNDPHHRNRRMLQTADSPIYSLSIPSATSPNLYAGVEGAVLSLTFNSIADRHPDPFFADCVKRFPDTGRIDVKKSYNPSGDALNLGMYEQGDENAVIMRLMVQDGIYMGVAKNAQARDPTRFATLDERWGDPGNERDRWSRGQDPGNRRGGHGGRGRGRGRGRRPS